MSLREEYEKHLRGQRKETEEDRQLVRPLYETLLETRSICPDGAEACAGRLRAVFQEAVSLVDPARWRRACLEFDRNAVELVPERDSDWGLRSYQHLEYHRRPEYVQVKGAGGALRMEPLLRSYCGVTYSVSIFGKDLPKHQLDQLRQVMDAYYRGVRGRMAGARNYVIFQAGAVLGESRHELILFDDGNVYQSWGEIPGYLDRSLYQDPERAVAKLLADVNGPGGPPGGGSRVQV